MLAPTRVTGMVVRDIRFPTSLEGDGSDAVHKDPDYSCTYLVLKTDGDLEGHGFNFTIGNGNQIVVEAVKAFRKLVLNVKLDDVFSNFGRFYRTLTCDSQLRWLGPEKGVIHLASTTILNAFWDLWAKIEGKPLWKMLVDMEPEKLIKCLDFKYVTDALTEEEALEMLKKNVSDKLSRAKDMARIGYPAYTTATGWINYDDDKIKRLTKQCLAEGFTSFKAKVGNNIDDDMRRMKIFREAIGDENNLMVDANQRWDVAEAIEYMKKLADYKILWIEEPTSPDDIQGHADIAKALNPLGIGVATGEHCQNRVMFKQFLRASAMQFCQIDSCRLGSVGENIIVLLMANKFNVPVCPHAGGVGLCELVQHLAFFDYCCVTGTTKNRMLEYVNHLHEHFKDPVNIGRAKYMPPTKAGYSADMKEKSLADFEFPAGEVWQKLFAEGRFERPAERD